MMSHRDETLLEILKRVETIAVVGLSSKEHRAGYTVPAYLQAQGYRIVPVNPHLDRALGEQAYPDLLSLPFPVDMVLIFRRPEAVPPVVEQAIEIGAGVVWMQLGITHQSAAEQAREAGIEVVMDSCMAIEHRRLLA